jgi:hypothetical protein
LCKGEYGRKITRIQYLNPSEQALHRSTYEKFPIKKPTSADLETLARLRNLTLKADASREISSHVSHVVVEGNLVPDRGNRMKRLLALHKRFLQRKDVRALP